MFIAERRGVWSLPALGDSGGSALLSVETGRCCVLCDLFQSTGLVLTAASLHDSWKGAHGTSHITRTIETTLVDCMLM